MTYSGTGATRSITGLGFSPDFTWIKERNNAVSHRLFDSVRGATKRMFSNNTDAESTQSNSLTSFDSDGFSLGDSGSVNGGSDTYVAWNWRASDSNAVSNTNGSITSTVSANTTAGFSIVTYTGTGSVATVGHGLGKAPRVVIVKRRDTSGFFWVVQHASIFDASDTVLGLDLSSGSFNQGGGNYNGTSAGSSVFTLGSGGNTNQSSGTYIAYCFAEIEGYSKFGSYTGNGSTDGAFVYTGFRPELVIAKKYSAGENWSMADSARSPHNVSQAGLSPSTSSAEDTTNGVRIDLLSNGFKPRDTAGQFNDNGASYIYMAFGHTFVDSNGNPNTGR